MMVPGGPPFVLFVIRRLFFALALVFVASSVSLLLVRVAPGDATTQMRFDGAPAASVAEERSRLGLDRPWSTQYRQWLAAALHLDLGMSFRYGRPVAPLVVERALNTGLLALAALALATLAGLPLGVLTATRPRSLLARGVRLGSVMALSWPPMLLSLVFAAMAARTGWLPLGGMRSPMAAPDALSHAWDVARHLVLPTLALAIPVCATFERLQSRALAATLSDPCVTAAAARGIPPSRLHFRHALRLALTPVTAVYGAIAGGLLGGSFGVEIVTAWPGLGRLLYEGLISRDLYLVAGCAALGSALVAVATVLSDVVAAWNDPRLREQVGS